MRPKATSYKSDYQDTVGLFADDRQTTSNPNGPAHQPVKPCCLGAPRPWSPALLFPAATRDRRRRTSEVRSASGLAGGKRGANHEISADRVTPVGPCDAARACHRVTRGVGVAGQ